MQEIRTNGGLVTSGNADIGGFLRVNGLYNYLITGAGLGFIMYNSYPTSVGYSTGWSISTNPMSAEFTGGIVSEYGLWVPSDNRIKTNIQDADISACLDEVKNCEFIHTHIRN